MNKLKSLSKKGWQFVLLTLILSCIPYSIILSGAGIDSDWTLLLMWMPALAGIIMRLVYKEGLFKGVSWNPFKNIKCIIIATFLPFAIEVLSMILLVMLDFADLKEDFITINNGIVSLRGTALLFGAHPQPWYIIIPHYLSSFFVGTLFYSVAFGLGEEYGWRGYLQKHWAPANSSFFPFLIIGLIWGWWHLPGILLGHNFPDYPIIGGFILMPLTTVFMSIVFGTSLNKTNLIWVPVIFHGALNISSDISNTGLVEVSINKPVSDVIWIGLWIITGLIFWRKLSKKVSDKELN
ncbi:MAG: CPBP family intramembrane glutamic endopeptidase [Fulvivirga sp.]|uniref:CPBP family intramembrane glutamic endopeptidase n=1 Tax=Fulvivirga sp. TaxID=1931237 RepID=UPI0032FF9021